MAAPWEEYASGSAGGDSGPWDEFKPSAKAPRSADYEKGRVADLGGLRGGFSALQGLTLGFGDEIAGAGGAIAGGIGNLLGRDDGTTFAERYKRVRDTVRGAQDQFMEDNPIQGNVARVVTGLPLMAVGAPAQAAIGVARAAPLGILKTAAIAAKPAAGFGAAQGVGDSTAEDMVGLGADALAGGATSVLLGSAINSTAAGIGGAYGMVKRGLSKKAAEDFARLKVAEALARDSRASRTAVPAVAIEDAQFALRDLGSEARVADAAGDSTRALLDTMATLPGRSKTLVEDAIRARQAGRGARIVGAADDALGTGGRGFLDEAGDLAAAKQAESFPLYDQIRDVPVRLTGEVKGILQRVPESAWAEAKQILKAEQGIDLNVADLLSGRTPVPLAMLDSVKRGLYEAAQAAKATNRKGVGNALDEVRQALVGKLDEISPKDAAGKSIYQSARETYGGFANLEELLQTGRKAMTDDLFDLSSAVKGLDPSQLQAFRVGALQALKQKAGSESGQTSLLKFWKEPGTQERLRVIFGDDPTFNQFVGALQREGTLKKLESVGRGSQTASRLSAIDDLDLNPTAMPAGIKERAVNALAQLYGRVKTPEATRDEIGRILLSQGEGGATELNALRSYLNRVNDGRTKRAAAAGAFAGVNF